MVVETKFNIGEEVLFKTVDPTKTGIINQITEKTYKGVIESININIRKIIVGWKLTTVRYLIKFNVKTNDNFDRIERTIVTEDKIIKIK